jgi:hypothetical protein
LGAHDPGRTFQPLQVSVSIVEIYFRWAASHQIAE